MPPYSRTCGICGQPINPFAAISYADVKNGIVDRINIHRVCYRNHILEHYPNSEIAQYLRAHPDEYTAADEPAILPEQTAPENSVKNTL